MNRSARIPALLLAFVATLGFHRAVAAAPAEYNLPDLGDESGALLSPRDERRLGEDFMREAYARLDIQHDPEINEYVRGLGHRLTKAVPGGSGFHFFVINNGTINAFAVPGGFVGVHSGLLLAARNEAEIAAVLAHESAHITQRHYPRLLSASQRLSGPALAAMIAGILIAASGQSGGEAAVALATAGLAQAQINFTRAFEQEADRIGMSYLDGAGFDARAMPAFFERMESLSRLYETNLPEFLRTHPVTGQRLAESLDHAEGFARRSDPDMAAFAHMQARVRVLASIPDAALRYFRSAVAQKDSPHPDADRYGYALALLATRQLDRARAEARTLLRKQAGFLPYELLLADIELEAGNTAASLGLYAAAARHHPDSSAAVLHYASALLKGKRPREARDLLDKAVRSPREDPNFYRLLAQAAGSAGRPLEAHRAYGEFYYRTGQPRAAIEQFEIARRYAEGNFYYQSSLEARIREIRESSGLLFKESGNKPDSPREKSKK
jgi:predicted Zn-dependent protease